MKRFISVEGSSFPNAPSLPTRRSSPTLHFCTISREAVFGPVHLRPLHKCHHVQGQNDDRLNDAACCDLIWRKDDFHLGEQAPNTNSHQSSPSINQRIAFHKRAVREREWPRRRRSVWRPSSKIGERDSKSFP
ncbi:hypothetical protein BLNAU_11965 [Blattamonas nauphoetae]|uniref:Uncharacterized protein n=1 Tax=Blattamonas nauphoetae TaxID=2049346 RepID=A0ABQ9XRE6_9EUKA|nr:hypothetical protein BLNAU_11965 [Blattamonas nauphoetae]